MSNPTGWELVAVGVLQGLGLLAVVWGAHQIRKGLYHHSKWRFFSAFDDRGTDLGRDHGPASDDGRALYWVPVENTGTGESPAWAYAPMVYEKPSWWHWMRRSYYYAFKHQQWKPVEYIHPAQMLASASAASQQSGGGPSAIAGCPPWTRRSRCSTCGSVSRSAAVRGRHLCCSSSWTASEPGWSG